MKTAIVTGSAGFVGFFISKLLLEAGYRVIGIDCFSDYYDVKIKKAREEMLLNFSEYRAVYTMIEKTNFLKEIFEEEKPSIVIHLAAQAGVRYSIENPRAYLESNIIGTFELLEAARIHPPQHMLIASTSSVYGANDEIPYRELDKTDHQMSFYAATKKTTENIAHSYSHLYDIPITMFRFFTVYGPWGRPDMALFKFTKAILDGSPIDVYNHGDMKRDFTYVYDLVHAIWLLIGIIPPRDSKSVDRSIDSLSPVAPFRTVNIGNSKSIKLSSFINVIEKSLGKKAVRNLMPMQSGDVPITWADSSLLKSLTGYQPNTSLQEGVGSFVDWYKKYYHFK
jgi:UDP-glucuronate 4-epimerase